jgi:hypothetical protein
MNKNVLLWVGIVLAVALTGAAIYYAKNDAGTGATNATSTESNATSTATSTQNEGREPAAPAALTSSNVTVSNSSAVVTGTVTPNGAQTAYWYEFGKTANLGLKTAAKTVGSGFAAIPAPEYITGLSANTQYYFRLVAKNSLGTSNGAIRSFTTNMIPPQQGSAPSVSSAGAASITKSSATIRGNVNPNGWDTSYWFEFGETANLGNVTAFQSAGGGKVAVNVSAVLSGLKPSTRYYYRVNAQNQFGTVNGAVLSFDTAGPVVPTVTTNPPTSITGVAASLNGRIDPKGLEATYWFEYWTDASTPGTSVLTTPKQTLSADSARNVSVTVTNLSLNTKYHVRLVVTNESGPVYGNTIDFQTRASR